MTGIEQNDPGAGGRGMRYRLLGHSGLKVSELCLGTLTFGDARHGATAEEAAAIYKAFREAGGNFLDTANEIYAAGASEALIGDLTSSHRDEMVIGTKFTNAADARDPNFCGNHRKSLIQSVERSLRRLKTDYIDLIWLHAWDYTTAPHEVMRALDDLVRAGKVLHLGASNMPAWLISRCNTLADARGQTAFGAVQIEYNLIARDAELETVPMADELGISVMAWSPLAMGVLTGKYLQTSSDPRRLDITRYRDPDAVRDLVEPLVTLATERGEPAAAMALAWLLGRSILPVIGARTLDQFRDCMRATEIKLSPEDMQALDQISPPRLSAPHDAIRGGRNIIYGGFFDRIDF